MIPLCRCLRWPVRHRWRCRFRWHSHFRWHRHFRWEHTILVGKTKTVVVTAQVLSINDPARVMLRENLLFEGRFPPVE